MSIELMPTGLPAGFDLVLADGTADTRVWHFASSLETGWQSAAEIAIMAHTREALTTGPFGGNGIATSFPPGLAPASFPELRHATLARSFAAHDLEGRISIQPLQTSIEADGTLRAAHFIIGDNDFLLGSFATCWRYVIRPAGEPWIVLICVKMRGTAEQGANAALFEAIGQLDVVVASSGAPFMEARVPEASPILRQLVRGQLDPRQIDNAAIAAIEVDLRTSSPLQGHAEHIVGRILLAEHALEVSTDPLRVAELDASLSEAARLALDMPAPLAGALINDCLRNKLHLHLLSSDQDQADWLRLGTILARIYSRIKEQPPNDSDLKMLLDWTLACHEFRPSPSLVKACATTVGMFSTRDAALSAITDILSTRRAQERAHTDEGIALGQRGMRRCQAGSHLLYALLARVDADTSDFARLLSSEIDAEHLRYQGMRHGMSAQAVVEYTAARDAEDTALPTLLYLRPLSALKNTDIPLRFPNGKTHLMSLESAFRLVTQSIFRSTNAVGGLPDLHGMRRSFSIELHGSEHWKMIAAAMMELAAAIIVLPDASDGVAWEIETIRSRGYLDKCVFVQLPQDHDWADGGNWQALSHHFPSLFPAALAPGGQFILGDPGNADRLTLPWAALNDGRLTLEIGRRVRLPKR